MKTFANCTNDEFIAQALRFREPFAEWLKKVGAPEIRKRCAKGYDEMTEQERNLMGDVFIGELIYAGFKDAPELTRECLCLATFTENFDDHTIIEYIHEAIRLYGNKDIRDFFTLLTAPNRWTSTEA